jgi:malate dehydrogenase (quinone)
VEHAKEEMTGQVTDVVLIGAGVMSATLGALLRKLDPSLTIQIFESLDRAAAESSDAWNNAGTGHSGFCELNYTPERPDGTVDVSKAVAIAEQFEASRQFWASLVEHGDLPAPDSFIREIPHLSFVWGERNIAFLRERHRALCGSPWFEGLEYSEDPRQIARWAPLVMEGPGRGAVAATRMACGNDVNFGALTRSLIAGLDQQHGVDVHLGHEVIDLRRDREWFIDVRDKHTGEERVVRARFVFIGAGGYSLTLLEKSGVPEARGYGAFPVSGQWLRCSNREVIARHDAKVYGKAEVGAPPMSVPHLDTRWIDGQKELLFGPYAGFTTRFLKQGSYFDFLGSLGIDNLRPLMAAGVQNLDLTRYLIGQALLSPEERHAVLAQYCPGARLEDWEPQIAGLRVQIIKSDGHGGGELKFGTEVVTGADGTIAALLGASPGASTAVAIMRELVQKCFPAQWPKWRDRCDGWIPSAMGCKALRARSAALLGR